MHLQDSIINIEYLDLYSDMFAGFYIHKRNISNQEFLSCIVETSINMVVELKVQYCRKNFRIHLIPTFKGSYLKNVHRKNVSLVSNES